MGIRARLYPAGPNYPAAQRALWGRVCLGWTGGGGGAKLGHQMVGRLNWMSPPSTIPAIVLSKFSAGSQCVRVFDRRLPRCFRPCSPQSWAGGGGGGFGLWV